MAPRFRVVGGIVILTLAVSLVVAGARYQVVQAVQDRIATDYTVDEAQFTAPDFLTWPRLTEGGAIAFCDICASPNFVRSGITAQYGVLVSDPGMKTFFSNQPSVAVTPLANIHLPRIAWILHWPKPCSESMPPHVLKCATYELIDDATGWVLDAGQDIQP